MKRTKSPTVHVQHSFRLYIISEALFFYIYRTCLKGELHSAVKSTIHILQTGNLIYPKRYRNFKNLLEAWRLVVDCPSLHDKNIHQNFDSWQSVLHFFFHSSTSNTKCNIEVQGYLLSPCPCVESNHCSALPGFLISDWTMRWLRAWRKDML